MHYIPQVWWSQGRERQTSSNPSIGMYVLQTYKIYEVTSIPIFAYMSQSQTPNPKNQVIIQKVA
jgi:hypothetical protein